MNRTAHDLQWLARNFASGRIKRGIPERLECLAAWQRLAEEAAKATNGERHDFAGANEAFGRAQERLRAAGVGPGEKPNSPWCGPDM